MSDSTAATKGSGDEFDRHGAVTAGPSMEGEEEGDPELAGRTREALHLLDIERAPCAGRMSDSDELGEHPLSARAAAPPCGNTSAAAHDSSQRAGCVERARHAAGLSDESMALGGATTVMLKNFPDTYTQRALLKEVDKSGFYGRYDFVVYPTSRSERSRRFAFINFDSADTARRFYDTFHMKTLSRSGSKGEVEVTAARIQGFYANAENQLAAEATQRQKGTTISARYKPAFLRPLPPDLVARYLDDAPAGAVVEQEDSPSAPAAPSYCPYCGNSRRADYAFCEFCGRRLPGSAWPMPARPLAAQPAVAMPMLCAVPVPMVSVFPHT